MQIHWRNMGDVDGEHLERVESRLRELAEGHTDLIDVRISGKPTQHHRHGGQEVLIVCQARGQDVVASRMRPDMELALQDAIDAFEREVRKMRELRTDRRTAHSAAPPVLGVIDRTFPERDYGFILTDGGEQIYFHRNALSGDLSFESLEAGQRVGLNVEGGVDGPQATVVLPPPPDAPSP